MLSADLPLYFENAAGRLLEYPDEFLVFQYHPGPRRLADLQELYTCAGQQLARRGWYKLLGDQRLMSPYTKQESAWFMSYWLDDSQERPVQTVGAILVTHEVFAHLSMDKVIEQSQLPAFTYRLFDSENVAISWLLRLP